MRKKIKTRIVIFSLVILSVIESQGQKAMQNWLIGINAGTMIYQGDLTPYAVGSYQTLKPAVSIYLSRILSTSFVLKTSFSLGSLKGDESLYAQPDWRRQRNFAFSSPVKEISETLTWNILKNSRGEGGIISPYIFLGAGICTLKISRDTTNMNTSIFGKGSEVQEGLVSDYNHTTPQAVLILPAGVGVEYSVSTHVSFTIETNFRYIFTDYLDGFSKSANPTKRDYYHTHTIGLLYRFSEKNRLGCPVIRY